MIKISRTFFKWQLFDFLATVKNYKTFILGRSFFKTIDAVSFAFLLFIFLFGSLKEKFTSIAYNAELETHIVSNFLIDKNKMMSYFKMKRRIKYTDINSFFFMPIHCSFRLKSFQLT